MKRDSLTAVALSGGCIVEGHAPRFAKGYARRALVTVKKF